MGCCKGILGFPQNGEGCAFRRPDGVLVVVLFNAGAESVPVNLRLGGQLAELTVEPKTIISGLIV